MQILKGLSKKELEEFFFSIGEKKFRANQLYQGLYVDRYESIDEFTVFSRELKEKLKNLTAIPSLKLKEKMKSIDGTVKFIFEVESGKEIESVWIPSGDTGRKTICVSSQVGCTLACAFCATGKLDFRGNLKSWQIIDQVLQVEKIVNDKATNVVFMGMGEPMHNYFSVIKAAHLLHSPDALNIGAKRITISTAGVITGIERFVENREPFNFAISLNHPDVHLRKTIMGIDEKYPLDELLSRARNFTKTLDRRITFEYVMIPGVNMDENSAEKLVRIGRSVNCKINLIPLNTEFNGWRRPTLSEVEQFQSLLEPAKVPVMVRRSAGHEIFGACGMLSLRT